MISIGYDAHVLDKRFLVLYGGAMDIIKNASETIFDRLVWHTAKRDQAGIAEKLTNGKYSVNPVGVLNSCEIEIDKNSNKKLKKLNLISGH